MSLPSRGVALRLEGPLQAWGGAVIGDNRPTLPFPTRSGVLGLVAACLGIERSDQERLQRLSDGTRVHVRVDAPGTPIVDDQTIQGLPRASELRQTIQSKRSYLCDASFTVVVVPGEKGLVEPFASALREPVFAPFLGRRCCVPSVPILLRETVDGNSALALFDTLPRGGAAPASKFTDFYLDGDCFPSTLRRLRVRDLLTGPLLRSWRERVVSHVRFVAEADDSFVHTDPIDDWFPQ
jgi:CRISPR system Cascade subunit CasD